MSAETVRAQTPAPTVTLEKSIQTNGVWSGYTTGNAIINVGNQVRLEWSSTDAHQCAGAGGDFSTYNARTGYDYYITEPIAGATITYSIICAGAGGTASSSITITTAADSVPVPTVTLEKNIYSYSDSTWSGYSTGNATINTNDTVL